MWLQDEQGLLFAPVGEIATLTPEYRDRWRVVLSDGTVANRPGPPPPGPWVSHGGSWVAPRHLVAAEAGWRDPAGFLYPAGDLPAPPEPEPERWPPAVPPLPCDPDRVISLLGYERNCYWHTDDGDIHWSIPAVRAAAAHPGLVKLSKGVFLNRARLRRIIKANRTVSPYEFVMDSGDRYALNGASGKLIAQRLGLCNLSHLEPHRPGLYRYHLRDYPYEIAKARGERLRADFPDRKHLMAHLVWQTLRYRQQGLNPGSQDTYRGFYYKPVEPAIYRAGYLARHNESDSDKAFYELQAIVRQMVGADRLFTFAELGFKDAYSQQRVIGTLRPDVVLLAEKDSLEPFAFQLAAEFGISCQITRGAPSLLETEYFARALGQVGQGPIQVIAYVDYDPGGWTIGESFVNQLADFGLPHVQPARFLVRAEHFTEEEIELNALPCPMGTPGLATKARQWVKKSGGINGRPLGIHANHLEPYARVRDCLARML